MYKYNVYAHGRGIPTESGAGSRQWCCRVVGACCATDDCARAHHSSHLCDAPWVGSRMARLRAGEASHWPVMSAASRACASSRVGWERRADLRVRAEGVPYRLRAMRGHPLHGRSARPWSRAVIPARAEAVGDAAERRVLAVAEGARTRRFLPNRKCREKSDRAWSFRLTENSQLTLRPRRRCRNVPAPATRTRRAYARVRGDLGM